MNNNAIVISNSSEVSMLPVEQMKSWYQSMVDFGKEILKEGHDYGVIPGTPKPCLLQPGAEKLRVAYGLQISSECIEKTENLSIGFLDYTYKCKISTPSGMIIGDKDGSANSYEPNFRYIWVPEHKLPSSVNKENLDSKGSKVSEFAFAIAKAETSGKYGKPAEYWKRFNDAIENGAQPFMKKASTGREMEAYEIDDVVYKIQNPDIMGKKNTIQKIAQKRSFVAAILQATGASEFFTQDLEDFHDFSPADFLEPNENGAVKSEHKKEEKKSEPKKETKQPAKTSNKTFDDYKTDLNSSVTLEDLKQTFITMAKQDSFLKLKEDKREELVKIKDELKIKFSKEKNFEDELKKNMYKAMLLQLQKCEDIEPLETAWKSISENPRFKLLTDDYMIDLQHEYDTLKQELSGDESIKEQN